VASNNVTDKKDGTGILVAVEGYSEAVFRAGAVNAPGTLATLATFAVDGSQSVSLSEGPYVGIWELDGDYAAPFFFRVTDATVGLHMRCVAAVRQFILDNTLPGYPVNPELHKIHKRPIRTMTEFGQNPNGVHYWMLPEQVADRDNSTISVSYPVQVALVTGSNGNNLPDDAWVYSRELILRSFPRCPLVAVPEVHTVTVEPGALYFQSETTLNVDLQSMIFRCVTELPSIYA